MCQRSPRRLPPRSPTKRRAPIDNCTDHGLLAYCPCFPVASALRATRHRRDGVASSPEIQDCIPCNSHDLHPRINLLRQASWKVKPQPRLFPARRQWKGARMPSSTPAAIYLNTMTLLRGLIRRTFLVCFLARQLLRPHPELTASSPPSCVRSRYGTPAIGGLCRCQIQATD